jgi:hypothetical protein
VHRTDIPRLPRASVRAATPSSQWTRLIGAELHVLPLQPCTPPLSRARIPIWLRSERQAGKTAAQSERESLTRLIDAGSGRGTCGAPRQESHVKQKYEQQSKLATGRKKGTKWRGRREVRPRQFGGGDMIRTQLVSSHSSLVSTSRWDWSVMRMLVEHLLRQYDLQFPGLTSSLSQPPAGPPIRWACHPRRCADRHPKWFHWTSLGPAQSVPAEALPHAASHPGLYDQPYTKVQPHRSAALEGVTVRLVADPKSVPIRAPLIELSQTPRFQEPHHLRRAVTALGIALGARTSKER